jgi:hypothetical protein
MRPRRSFADLVAGASARAGRALAHAWDLARSLPRLLRRRWTALIAGVQAVGTAIRTWLHRARLAIGRTSRRVMRLGRATLLTATVAVLLAAALGGSAYAASRLNAEYGAGQEQVNTITWAIRAPSYAGATCVTCHAGVEAAQAASHATVSCEGCHGPLVDHPAADGGTDSRLVVPDSAICITCHAAAAGQPVGFPVIEPDEHYSGAECLRCHDPHAVIAAAPPDVTHPLERLPACTTCHAPDGLKEVPSGHEMVADEVCLSCHGVPDDD